MSSEHGRLLRGLPPTGVEVQDLVRSESGFGRFGRMFPDLPVAVYGADTQTTFPGSLEALIALAGSMLKADPGAPITEAEPEDENPEITAGYTYFGQFIDHDLTFDTASSLDRVNDPRAVQDFRTSRFDLDSLYGKGPSDQPYLYRAADGFCSLHQGEDKAPTGLPPRFDLARNADGRAMTGDPRNDENKLVSQFHALFTDFHNILIGLTPQGTPDRFLKVQQQVRFHYQWLVVNDFLKTILDRNVWATYFSQGLPALRFYRKEPETYPFIPVEFAVAAYRFGHSMIRPSYSLNNPVLTDIDAKHPRIPVFSGDPEPRNNLNGFGPLPDFWGIDWSFFFAGVAATSALDGQIVPQPSYRIDSLLVGQLAELPEMQGQTPDWRRSLAARNLVRGRALGLPSGQRVALAIGETPLSDDALWRDPGNLDAATAAKRLAVYDQFHGFKMNAPLWYYVLREAEITQKDGGSLGGHRLGVVGSTIVAETFAALLLNDQFSYLSVFPAFQPDLEGEDPASFTIASLINFVDRHH
ncbi:peroxidase family protein [Caulobacter sp. Root1455]|uniref:peroxidase family protein n=1 Tax=Caulobacter sp. Root1455 TaxID=1736465 RepID=UPI0009E710EF|nr:heme peroxidase family protein [Caulobacter sp. Root1455]